MIFFIIAGISTLIVYFMEIFKKRKTTNYEEVTGLVTYVYYENIYDHLPRSNILTSKLNPYADTVEKTGIHQNKHAVTVIYTYNGVEYRKTFSRPYRITSLYHQSYRNPYWANCLMRYSEGDMVNLLVDPINQEVYFKDDIILSQNQNPQQIHNGWMLIIGILLIIIGIMIGYPKFF